MTAHEYPIEDARFNEDDPLLPNTNANSRPTTPRSHASFIHQTHSSRVIIFILFIIIFVLAFGGTLIALPAIRLYEDIICHHYYESLEGEGHIGLEGNIDESLCKGDEVQNELNVLLAGLQFLGAIPGLVMTIPYGLLADRKGRKFVFVLAMVGLILGGSWNLLVVRFWRVFPLRCIWLSPAFVFIGGGEAVVNMMFYAIGCDVTTESNRANVFLLGGSAGLVAALIAPSVASSLMEKSPWIPLLIGLTTLVFGTCLIAFIPETVKLHPSHTTELTPDSSSDRRSSGKLDELNYFETAKTQIVDALTRVYESTTVLHSLPILLLLITFIVGPFGAQSSDLSLRYISRRFSWKLSEAGFLLSLRAFVNIVLLLIILPSLSYYLSERLHYSSKTKDLSLAQFSAVMYVTGSLIFAASPNIGLTIIGMVIWTLGTGFNALTRSLITTLVDKEHIARLYAAIAVVDTASSLAAGPSLAALYAAGLKLKGPWIGLPFFGLAFISFISGLGVWCFGLLKKPQEEMPYGDEDRDTIMGDTVFLEGDTVETGVINEV